MLTTCISHGFGDVGLTTTRRVIYHEDNPPEKFWERKNWSHFVCFCFLVKGQQARIPFQAEPRTSQSTSPRSVHPGRPNPRIYHPITTVSPAPVMRSTYCSSSTHELKTQPLAAARGYCSENKSVHSQLSGSRSHTEDSSSAGLDAAGNFMQQRHGSTGPT